MERKNHFIDAKVVQHFAEEHGAWGINLESVQKEATVIRQFNPLLEKLMVETIYLNRGAKLLYPLPFLQDSYLSGVYVAHLILRMQKQRDEDQSIRITEEALNEYKTQVEFFLGPLIYSSRRLPWMENTIEAICPGIIETIFPFRCHATSFVEASTMLGLLDVFLPSKITLARDVN